MYFLAALAAAGCGNPAKQQSKLDPSPATMQAVSLNDPAQPRPLTDGVDLAGARNEWTSFTLQISDLPQADGYWVRIHEPEFQTANEQIALNAFEASQILPMPIDLDRAGFVRQTGRTTAGRELPRALLSVGLDSQGELNLEDLRDPHRPADPAGHVGGASAAPALIWVDLHIPPGASPGDYATRVDLLRAGDDQPVASVPLRLTVYDFDMPDQRHLQMIGQLSWDQLVQHFPDWFEAVTPRLVNRTEDRYSGTVRVMDQLMALAQKNRTALFIPRLQPTVKWDERGKPPSVDWRDFDTLLAPWLKGDAFPDRVKLTYWPLPAPDLLDNWNRKSQLDYWFEAATHFDEMDWLGNTAVNIEQSGSAARDGRVGTQESLELSAQAAEILAIHPRIRVMLPLEDDQLQFADSVSKGLIDSSTTPRILASVPGLVFAPPEQPWPHGVAVPGHWLPTQAHGLLPYVGAGGDDYDVRTWAFLAFLRRAQFILWDSPLPKVSSRDEPGDPSELVWFYPGSWFGRTDPVPTIQLKWLRRAEEDFEYLYLARQRGEVINAMQMARLITKPVEIARGSDPDPTYSLMSGTTDAGAWHEASKLLAQSILLRQPNQPVDAAQQRELYIRTLQWARPQERPLLVGRSADWSWDTNDQGEDWIDMHVGLDIYNASDDTPGDNVMQWAELPSGWEIAPQPISVPRLQTYHVLRTYLDARFNARRVDAAARSSMEADFIDGFTKVVSPLQMVLPVAACDKREGRLSIDGSLSDWTNADSIQDGPMVVMLNRPALQRQELQRAATPTRIYSAWADKNFYLAFALQGLSEQAARHAQNFVTYKDRRAWGEDLCEMLIQPIYADKTLGEVLHIVCKPNGGVWVERKLDPRFNVEPWQTLEGAGVRYAATIPDNGAWNGELAIPWKLIGDEKRGLPALLRFNFVQHRTATGESASWCGPVDFGRDDALMGIIFLRTADEAGAVQVIRGGAPGGQ